MFVQRSVRFFPPISAGQSLRAGMNRSLFRSHIVMCITFSTLHGVVDGTLAFVVAELGESKGSWSSFLLYLCFCISALFIAKPVVEICGAKRTIQYGSRCMFIYVLSFFLAIVFRENDLFAWIIFMSGGIIGGLGAGCLWAGQGAYFTINAQRYASLMVLDINIVTAWFASIFATTYLLMETIFKTLAAIIYFAHSGDYSWLPMTFGLYTMVAVIAGEIFRIKGKDMKTIQESPSKQNLQLSAMNNNNNNTFPAPSPSNYSNFTNNFILSPTMRDRLAVARKDAFAVLRLVINDKSIQCLLPFQAAFGLSSGMFGFYVNASIVRNNHGSGYIGLLSAWSTLTACLVAPILGAISSKKQYGRFYAMLLGGISFVYLGIIITSCNPEQLANWGNLVVLYFVHGISRGVWECSNKEEISVAFQGSEDMPAAFAALYVTSGGVTALGYLFYQYMDRLGIGLINLIVSLMGILGYLLYLYTSPLPRSTSNRDLNSMVHENDIDIMTLDDTKLGENRQLDLNISHTNITGNMNEFENDNIPSRNIGLPLKMTSGREKVRLMKDAQPMLPGKSTESEEYEL